MIKQSDSDIRGPSLASQGKRGVEWAEPQMPAGREVLERFAREAPLVGINLAACLRVELRSLGMEIDELTSEPPSYLESWEMGT